MRWLEKASRRKWYLRFSSNHGFLFLLFLSLASTVEPNFHSRYNLKFHKPCLLWCITSWLDLLSYLNPKAMVPFLFNSKNICWDLLCAMYSQKLGIGAISVIHAREITLWFELYFPNSFLEEKGESPVGYNYSWSVYQWRFPRRLMYLLLKVNLKQKKTSAKLIFTSTSSSSYCPISFCSLYNKYLWKSTLFTAPIPLLSCSN